MRSTVLLVAHGQPSAPEEGESRLEELRSAVSAACPEIEIRSATLAAEAALERQLDGVDAVYPVFMAEGYFTRRVLPKRLARAGAAPRLLSPLGIRADVLAYAARIASEGRADAPGTALLLAAHGSGTGDAARRAAEQARAFIAARTRFSSVTLGFIEEAPFLDEAARATARPAICLPLFAFEGGHMQEDVPRLLRAGGFEGPVLAPLGVQPDIPALIAAQLRTEAA